MTTDATGPRVVVPFDARDPKTRLADALDPGERRAFSRAMLDDVLAALRGSERAPAPTVLATADVDTDGEVVVDDRPLTDAVNAVIEGTAGPVAVVMADLALATPRSIDRLFAAAERAEVAIAPGRAGGTNAFVTAHPGFRVDYHGTSYLDHLAIAREVGATVIEVDSHRLATDIDERADLLEILLHGEGRAGGWLRDAGFRVAVREGAVELARE